MTFVTDICEIMLKDICQDTYDIREHSTNDQIQHIVFLYSESAPAHDRINYIHDSQHFKSYLETLGLLSNTKCAKSANVTD